MDLILVITFVVLGVAFFILEIFFLPGVSIGGIVGTLFTGAGIWYAFAKLGVTAGWIVVAVSVAILLFAIVYFIKGLIFGLKIFILFDVVLFMLGGLDFEKENL